MRRRSRPAEAEEQRKREEEEQQAQEEAAEQVRREAETAGGGEKQRKAAAEETATPETATEEQKKKYTEAMKSMLRNINKADPDQENKGIGVFVARLWFPMTEKQLENKTPTPPKFKEQFMRKVKRIAENKRNVRKTGKTKTWKYIYDLAFRTINTRSS